MVQQPDKFSRRKGGLRGPRVWSIQELDSKALAEGLKANCTLTNLSLGLNHIADEGAKAWWLVRMVRKKGIARSKIQALESEVSVLKEIYWRNMQSEFFWISHVAKLAFTSQWLKIFSESPVIKVSNSNSKEEQIRIVHHWWATSHGPPMVWSGFSAWNFLLEILMICASCFCSHLSPCQALAEALEENSTLTDLDLRANYVDYVSETYRAGVSGGEVFALLGARVRGLPKPS